MISVVNTISFKQGPRHGASSRRVQGTVLMARSPMRSILALLGFALCWPCAHCAGGAGSPTQLVFVVVGGLATGSSIQVLALDTCTGKVTPVSASKAGGVAPSFIAWQPGASPPSHLFAINEANGQPSTGLTAVRWVVDPAKGEASIKAPPPGSTQFVAVPDPAHVAVSRSGRWALTASYNGGTVSVVPVSYTGASGNGRQQGQLTLGAPRTLPTELVGQKAHQVALDPSGRFVYVPCLGSDWIRAFTFDDSSGQLLPLTLPSSGNNTLLLPAGTGPRHLAFHPTLPVAYSIHEPSSTVARLDWDRSTGALAADFKAQPQRLVSTLPPGTPQGCHPGASASGCKAQAAAELVLSTDGRFLYASNRGNAGGVSNIAILSVSPGDGALTPIAWEDGGGDVSVPRHISLAAGDAFLLSVVQDSLLGLGTRLLLVANQDRDTVTVFLRDAATGRLTKKATTSTAGAVAQPSFVAAVSPDAGGSSQQRCGP